MKAAGVYAIESPTGLYIGSASNLARRKREHFSALRRADHGNSRLQRAFRKYGETLTFRVLIVCHPADMLFFEQRAIDQLHPNYNICPIAGNTLGVKRSPETRLAKSLSMKGKKQPPELVAARRAGLMGHVVTDETKAKLAAQAGWKHSNEARQKMVGRVVTDQTRELLASRSRGNKHRSGAIVSDEMKRRISDKLKGRPRSPEAIAKHRATLIARKAVKAMLSTASTAGRFPEGAERCASTRLF